jgi:hypothetical protein
MFAALSKLAKSRPTESMKNAVSLKRWKGQVQEVSELACERKKEVDILSIQI